MGLDVWFREDIANAIMAAGQACAATAAMIEEIHSDEIQLRAYRRGYQAALTTVALAFGIPSNSLTTLPGKMLQAM